MSVRLVATSIETLAKISDAISKLMKPSRFKEKVGSLGGKIY
jgi:hypothetical protein